MTLDDFLKQFVEGYLFEDLRSMAAIKVPAGQKYGGVGYPMVMTTLAGVELLGVLTSAKSFDLWEGRDRFREFWRGFMYPGQPAREEMADLVYQFVRNGLAHTFVTKPMIVVTKEHYGDHLCKTANDSICIDALHLADELRSAYDLRVKPQMEIEEFRQRVETRFREFRDSYREFHQDKQHWFAGVPQGLSFARFNAATNSPSVNPVYPTNAAVSGVPRLDDE